MKIRKRILIIFSAIILLTAALTFFYYKHESFPKPFRAATALLATPVAIASGISNYLNLGIPVYESPWAVGLSNFIFSVMAALVINYLIGLKKRNKKGL